MSTKKVSEKQKNEDDFQECEQVLLQLEKDDLVSLLKSFWETKNSTVKSMIQNVVSKKQRLDEERKQQIEQDMKDIYETNWVFPHAPIRSHKRPSQSVHVEVGDRKLNIPTKTIKLGLYHEITMDINIDETHWDDVEGKLIATITARKTPEYGPVFYRIGTDYFHI